MKKNNMEQEKPKVCINCAKRTTCKTEDELRKMENDLIQHSISLSMYGIDPKATMIEITEKPNSGLNCSEYELDPNFSK